MASSAKRPNLLCIVADDLGFSDVGCYGGEINTPNIDKLAKDGLRMLNYHTAAGCSPTRAMLLTGTDAHIGGLGCLIEHRRGEEGAKRWEGKAGYEGYLNKDVATLAEILEDNGYFTALSGKWHLGMRHDAGPWARGFQKNLTMLPGCCNHYGYEPALEDGSTGMPFGGRPLHAIDGERYDVGANKTEDPNGFYSSNRYGDTMIKYLSERTEEEKAKPFFGYLAFTAPHWPLQCSKATRDKYKGMYDDGPMALRKRRLESLVKMGIIKPDVVPHEVVMNPGTSEWESFSDYEKKCSNRAMEAYAGLVEEMDRNIGNVIDHLKRTGEYDNTMIVFMSDNGAEGASYEALPVIGNKIKEAITKFYDNSLENIGAWNSYVWLGPEWAQASTAPSRLYKMFPSQGGILVPCVVKAPAQSRSSIWKDGAFNRSFTTCMDIAPTFLDLINVSLPVQGKKVAFRDRQVHPMTGKSWKSYLLDNTTSSSSSATESEEFAIYLSDYAVGWELLARAALKKGHWKIVHLPKAYKGKADPNVLDDPEGWELFNLADDPGETTDLAARNPEKMKELMQDWDQYVQDAGLVWGPGALENGLSKQEAPELHDDDFEFQKSWMTTPHGQKPDLTDPALVGIKA